MPVCIWGLVSRKQFGSMEEATRRDMEGTIGAEENTIILWIRFVQCKGQIMDG